MLNFSTRNSEIGIRKQHDITYTSVGLGGPSSTYTSVGPRGPSSAYISLGPGGPNSTYTILRPHVLATPTLVWAKFGACLF